MNIPTSIKSDGGWTVEGASPALLDILLGEYSKVLSELAWPLNALVPGVDKGRVRSAASSVGLDVPEELLVWYGWQNGLSRDQNGHLITTLPLNFEPASLDVAIASYAIQERDWIPAGLWARGWLSLDTNYGLSIYCDGKPDAPCLARMRFVDEYDFLNEYEPFQTVSLCTVVSWWIEAVTTGAVWRDNTGSGWDFDPGRCREIDHGTLMLS